MSTMPSANKLVSYVGIAFIVIFIFALIIIDNKFPKNDNLAEHLKSIISNLLSSLITFLALYYFLNRDFFEEGDTQKPNTSIHENPIVQIIQKETDKIDDTLSTILKSVSKIDNNLENKLGGIITEVNDKFRTSEWDEYLYILQSLRGYWIEYIPARKKSNSEFSIALFGLNKYNKHEFSGISYDHTKRKVNYKWESKKLLHPISPDENTIYIYLIYSRIGGIENDNKYGLGKLIAKKKPGSTNDHSFVEGFFFNESNLKQSRPVHEMKFKRLYEVAEFIKMPIQGKEEDPESIYEFLQALKKETNYLKKW